MFYIVDYNVYCCYYSVFIDKYVYTKFRFVWLLCECYLYHDCNALPEAVYCCFTKKLHCLPNCVHTYMIKVGGCHHVTKFHCTTLSSF